MNTKSLVPFLISAMLCSGHAEVPLWLAIGDRNFNATLRVLAEHRKGDGLEVMVSEGPVSRAIAAAPRKPDYILLVGDDVVGRGDPPPQALKAERRSLYRWRSTQAETFVSDSIFGDLDHDGIPEVPVGRIPARNSDQLEKVIAKILAYEQQPATAADLSLPVWAGNPNYGNVFQANMASNLLRQTLQNDAPAWADLWLMMGSAADPLAGVPPAQGAWFNARIARGGAIVGMMGHGSVDAFYSMPYQGKWITYNTRSVPSGPVVPTAPTIIFACDCGNFAHGGSSLAEALLYSPNGPVAAIGATTESHPLPNYYSSVSFLQTMSQPIDRLGDLWIETQRRGYEMRNALIEMFLKDIEGKLEAKLDTPRIRQDHLMLYALLGDPATKLRLPKVLKVKWLEQDGQGVWSVPKMAGATRLEIGYRGEIPNLKPRMAAVSEPQAKQQFEQANSQLVFQPLKTLSAAADWAGTLTKPGSYRFVVHRPSRIACAAHVLRKAER